MGKRIAVITGASSGMGREFARQIDLLQQSDELWLIARNADALAAVVAEERVAEATEVGAAEQEPEAAEPGVRAGTPAPAAPGGKSAEAMFAEAIASTLGVVDKIDFDSLTFETDDE